MKRKDLMKALRAGAKEQGHVLVESEGGKHTKVSIGDRRSTVPRHSEINEITAQEILKQMGVQR